MALYVSDVAFALLVLAWAWWRTHQGAQAHPLSTSLPRMPILVGAAFVLWAVVRAMPLYPSLLGWYAAGRVAQGFLLALITADLWKVPLLRSWALRTLVAIGVLQSLLGIAQVSASRDFGLRFIGEQPLSLKTSGVAKVDIMKRIDYSVNGTESDLGGETGNVPSGTKVLRAYGTFQHPNVLGWFLLASAYALLERSRTEHTGHNGGTGKKTRESSWNGLFQREHFLSVFIPASVLSAGIFATFSRLAWIGLALFSVLLLVSCFLRSGRNICKSINFMLFYGLVTGVAVLLPVGSFREAALSRIVPPGTDQFVSGRTSSIVDLNLTKYDVYIMGYGSGSGIVNIVRSSRNVSGGRQDSSSEAIEPSVPEPSVPVGTKAEPWEYQYPHSVPAVILLELGIVGIGLFLVFLSLILAVIVRARRAAPALLRSDVWLPAVGVLMFLPSFLLDHFPWTTQQGRILLWGGIGVLLSFASRGAVPRVAGTAMLGPCVGVISNDRACANARPWAAL